MKLNLERILFATAAVCALVTVSCKKEESVTTLKYFSGTIRVNLPAYVEPGQTIHLSPGDLKKEDGSTAIGFYWKIKEATVADTVRRESDPLDISPDYDFVVPDTVGTVELMVGAFASGYYSTVASSATTVVKPGINRGSLTGFDLFDDDSLITDSRDGKTYLTMLAGDTRWMRQNLAYEASGIRCFDSGVMTGLFGMFYTWEEARNGNVCPEGWELPSENDWVELAEFCGDENAARFGTFTGIAGKNMVDASFNGKPVWEFWPQVRITNESHFAALSTGFCDILSDSHKFRGWSEYAGFWTGDETDDSASGVYRYFHVESDNIFAGKGDKTNLAMSVRCIRKKK